MRRVRWEKWWRWLLSLLSWCPVPLVEYGICEKASLPISLSVLSLSLSGHISPELLLPPFLQLPTSPLALFLLLFQFPSKNQFSATLSFLNPFLSDTPPDSSFLSIECSDHHLKLLSSSHPPILPFLLCFSSLPSLYLFHCSNHHHGKVVTSIAMHPMQVHLEAIPLTPTTCCQLLPGLRKKKPLVQEGSRNMPFFDRVHECKEYEYYSEKKVWIMNGTKWTLLKKKKDPQRYTSRTQTRSNQ